MPLIPIGVIAPGSRYIDYITGVAIKARLERADGAAHGIARPVGLQTDLRGQARLVSRSIQTQPQAQLGRMPCMHPNDIHIFDYYIRVAVLQGACQPLWRDIFAPRG